ncbi:AAA family ATPase [Nocardioides sp. NPDC087217]|uniref:helix-turn-helix transcriptional regulator n=1 Tax=Nocardioides sp. NPDC087217 TaxID=3364335 RepID=UPI003826C08B
MSERPTLAYDLVGRTNELSRLSSLVDASGQAGTSLLIEGDAGIGKSTLLRAAVAEAVHSGYRVLRCTGLQGSSPVGFSALHELLRPLLADHLPALPSRQREAIATVFSLADGPAPDRLLVGIAALGLLEEAAEKQPLFLAVEDLHWIDHATAHTLAFVSLRLEGAPVLMVATSRPSWRPAAELVMPVETMWVPPLDEDAAAELTARRASGLPAAARRRVLRESAGNPLALCELSTALLTRSNQAELGSALPTTSALERAFLAQAIGLGPASRRLLLLAAAADDAPMVDILEAAKSVGLGLGDLAPLEDRGLLRVVDGRPQFRHPLLRAAVLGSASTASLQETHGALAGSIRDPDRAVWHQAAATFERDDAVAEAMEDAARRARSKGALSESAAGYQRAAALSGQVTDRARRLSHAADAARAAGMGEEALEILNEADQVATEPQTLAELATTRIALSLTTGLGGHPRADWTAVTSRLPGAENAARQVQILWGAALNARGRNLPPDDWRRLETQIRAVETDSPLKPVALALLAPLGHVEEDIRAQLPRLVSELRHFPLGMVSLAIAAESLQDLETALTCWGLSRELFHERGAPADEAQALRGRAALLLLRGRIREGLADAEFAGRMARDTAQPLIETMCVATVARAYAMLGEPEAMNDALARLSEIATTNPLAMASAESRWATGIVALAHNHYRDALIEFTHMSVHPTRALWAIADRTEAAVRADRVDTIRENVTAADKASRAYRSAFLTSLVGRSKALIAEVDGEAVAVEDHFRSAVRAGELSESPFELARTHLLFGEWLRRERRPVDARPHLKSALAVFDAVGAKMLAGRAASEARAAGEVLARPDQSSWPAATVLTPQELQVALLAARGMTNKEIADRIYLSHRTVSTHLYKAFPKLGVASRAQLRDTLTDAGHTI